MEIEIDQVPKPWPEDMWGMARSCLGVLLICIALTYAGCSYLVAWDWKSQIPAKIEVGRKIKSNTPLIAPPGGSCGGAFFKLNPQTKKQILLQGWDFFVDAETSRSEKTEYQWRRAEESGSHLTAAINCTTGKDGDHVKIVGTTHPNSGNYFADAKRYKTQIAVFMDKDTVFVGYWD